MKKLDYDYCHAAPVLEWMSQKWALVAMMIEGEGLVERTSYESIPPCVEYSLTPLAQNFLREISYIVEWGNCTSRRFSVTDMMKTDKALYLFELKQNRSAEAAIKQIDLKKYASKFALAGLPIVKVGINFDPERRTIGDWKVEP